MTDAANRKTLTTPASAPVPDNQNSPTAGPPGALPVQDCQLLETAADQNLRLATILVVDDDPDVREYAVSVLEELGYRVMRAGDGESALDLLEREPEIDLLFTDVVMPGLTGFEVARIAQSCRPELRLLFASGYATDLTPAGRLLKKPYRINQLASQVASVLPEELRAP